MQDDTTTPARKQISVSLRFEVMRRDGHACTYCGGTAPDVKLTIDHVIPVALGGSDDPSNLVTACKDCNAGKGTTAPDAHKVAAVDEQALRYRDAMARAAEQIREKKDATDELTTRFGEYWDSWKRGTGPSMFKPSKSWRQTVLNYVERGLPAENLFDNIEIAMKGPAEDSEKWRYFCGVCKNQVAELAELAIKIMAERQRGAVATADPYPDVRTQWECDICGEAASGVFVAPDDRWRWHSMCEDCEQVAADGADGEEWPYWIHISRIGTQQQVDTWTAHLSEKTWFNFRSWEDVVRKNSPGFTATEQPEPPAYGVNIGGGDGA